MTGKDNIVITFMIFGKHGALMGRGIVKTWQDLEAARKSLEENGQKLTITECNLADKEGASA
jgi:hypothetical protein